MNIHGQEGNAVHSEIVLVLLIGEKIKAVFGRFLIKGLNDLHGLYGEQQEEGLSRKGVILIEKGSH